MPALTINSLAEIMRDAAARALDPSQRYSNETDAIMYGKIVQLDSIAEGLYTASGMSAEDESSLLSAARLLERAFHHLAPIVCPDICHH